MPDLDDASFAEIEIRQRRKAVDLMKDLWPFTPYPQLDGVGITRHGYGRPINERPLSAAAAEVELVEQLSHIQQVLKFRVFEVMANHPDAEERIAYIYLVGDVIKPELLAEWSELWKCVRVGDWEGVAVELMSAEWEKRIELTRENRRKLLKIVNRIQNGEPA